MPSDKAVKSLPRWELPSFVLPIPDPDEVWVNDDEVLSTMAILNRFVAPDGTFYVLRVTCFASGVEGNREPYMCKLDVIKDGNIIDTSHFSVEYASSGGPVDGCKPPFEAADDLS